MAFGSLNRSGASAPMTEINIIPLVDVMLVLLVIFIITAPLLTHSVKVELPQASSMPNLTKPDNVQLAIDGSGQLFWNGAALSRSELSARLLEAGQRKPVPELHLHADRNTRYELLAELMSEASRVGVGKIGFVSDPAAP